MKTKFTYDWLERTIPNRHLPSRQQWYEDLGKKAVDLWYVMHYLHAQGHSGVRYMGNLWCSILPEKPKIRLINREKAIGITIYSRPRDRIRAYRILDHQTWRAVVVDAFPNEPMEV